jgi:hypothetical protein
MNWDRPARRSHRPSASRVRPQTCGTGDRGNRLHRSCPPEIGGRFSASGRRSRAQSRRGGDSGRGERARKNTASADGHDVLLFAVNRAGQRSRRGSSRQRTVRRQAHEQVVRCRRLCCFALDHRRAGQYRHAPAAAHGEPLGSQLQPCRLVRWTGGHRRHSVTLPRLGSVVGFGHARILSVTNDPSARGVPHGCAKTTQLLAARCRAWS